MTGVGEIDPIGEACFESQMAVRREYLTLERAAAKWAPAPMPAHFERPWEEVSE